MSKGLVKILILQGFHCWVKPILIPNGVYYHIFIQLALEFISHQYRHMHINQLKHSNIFNILNRYSNSCCS